MINNCNNSSNWDKIHVHHVHTDQHYILILTFTRIEINVDQDVMNFFYISMKTFAAVLIENVSMRLFQSVPTTRSLDKGA